jgi:hypothetical protein
MSDDGRGHQRGAVDGGPPFNRVAGSGVSLAATVQPFRQQQTPAEVKAPAGRCAAGLVARAMWRD